MKFLDSTGLSTVVKYIKQSVPFLGTNGKIPTKYITGSTVTPTTAVEANGFQISGTNRIWETENVFEPETHSGFFITNYTRGIVAFVAILVDGTGKLSRFYISPIMDAQNLLESYINDNGFVYMVLTSSGYKLGIISPIGRTYIRPFCDKDKEDAILSLRSVSKMSDGTLSVPKIVS